MINFKYFCEVPGKEKIFLLEKEFENLPGDLNEGEVTFVTLYERLYRKNERLLVYHTTFEVVEQGYIDIFETEGNFDYLYGFLTL